jgi:cell division transport system permease protein
MKLNILRPIKTGFKNFHRNGWLSVATISIIMVTVFIINIQIAIVMSDELLLNDIKEKISISVYFDSDASEDQVMKAKDEFKKYQEVASVEYISKDKALEDFKSENANNEILIKSLDEIESNPFEPTLNIKAYNPQDYELIARMIEESESRDVINTVNYDKHSSVINSFGAEIKSSQQTGLALGLTLVIVAILITFNTVRITMFAHNREIEIMRLVGATNNYIRMPFIWEGVLYGLISVLIALPASFAYLKFVAISEASGVALPISKSIYIQKFLDTIFLDNIFLIVPAELGVGILLGVLSAFIAIGKYLREKKR